MNKKGIEVAVNFLVVLIITMVIFGLGLTLAFNFFGKSETLQAGLDAQTKNEIGRLLISGEKVAIPYAKQSIRAGEHHVFGLGVYNEIGEEKLFKVRHEFSLFTSDNNVRCTSQSSSRNGASICSKARTAVTISMSEASKQPTIANSEQKLLPFVAKAKDDAPLGTYVYNVKVTYDSDIQYGTMKKIYLTVD